MLAFQPLLAVRLGLCAATLALAAAAQAQTRTHANTMTTNQTAPQYVLQNAPQNVLQLSAHGSVEVRQDLLILALSTERDGATAAQVQEGLRVAVNAALDELKKTAEPKQMEVQTGEFSVFPRYGKNSKISGWQGSATVLLQGRDFPRITDAAARASSMSIASVSFDLSREQRAQAESEAQKQAIDAFKARAEEIARAFGFASYTLREVSVGNDFMLHAAAYAASADSAPSLGKARSAPVVEPGKSTVRVTVSGTVQAVP